MEVCMVTGSCRPGLIGSRTGCKQACMRGGKVYRGSSLPLPSATRNIVQQSPEAETRECYRALHIREPFCPGVSGAPQCVWGQPGCLKVCSSDICVVYPEGASGITWPSWKLLGADRKA